MLLSIRFQIHASKLFMCSSLFRACDGVHRTSCCRRVYRYSNSKFRLSSSDVRLFTTKNVLRKTSVLDNGNKSNLMYTNSSNNCVYPKHGLQCNSWVHLRGMSSNKSLFLGSFNPNFNSKAVRHLSSESTVGTPLETAGFYKFLSESAPVVKTQELLVQFHDISGLPWWATIILSTVFLRTFVTLPLAIYQNYVLAKVENLTHEMSSIVEELKKETAYAIKKFNWTPKQARIVYNRSLRKQWNKLVVRDNCHPAKASILVIVQIPMWLFLSFALRNLVYMLPHQDAAAQVTCLEMSLNHFLWIPSLVSPDGSWALPVIFGLTNLAIIEIQTLSRLKEGGKIQKFATNFFRVVSIVMIPVAANVPACLNIYWVTSSMYGLVQNLVLMSPRVKKMFGIPRTPSTQDTPYQHIASQLKKRLSVGNKSEG